jgi:hypothetical protein
MKDRNGIKIEIGLEMEVGNPKTEDDGYKNSFVGFALELDDENDIVVVEDLDGDCFAIDSDNVSVCK